MHLQEQSAMRSFLHLHLCHNIPARFWRATGLPESFVSRLADIQPMQDTANQMEAFRNETNGMYSWKGISFSNKMDVTVKDSHGHWLGRRGCDCPHCCASGQSSKLCCDCQSQRLRQSIISVLDCCRKTEGLTSCSGKLLDEAKLLLTGVYFQVDTRHSDAADCQVPSMEPSPARLRLGSHHRRAKCPAIFRRGAPEKLDLMRALWLRGPAPRFHR